MVVVMVSFIFNYVSDVDMITQYVDDFCLEIQ